MDSSVDSNNLFDEIYLRYSQLIFCYFYARTRDKGLSEELTNDTFMIAYKKFDDFKNMTNKKAWLYVVAKNTYQHYRDRDEKKKIPTIPIDDQTLESIITYEMNDNDLDQFKAFLKPKEMEMLLYRYSLGYSITEIAAFLNISYSNCTSRLNRIKIKVENYFFKM